MEPNFDDAPSWVRTFYWVPIIGFLARRWLESHGAYRPAEPPSSADPGGDSGVREPRRPRPSAGAGAGAVALDEPIDDLLDGTSGSYEPFAEPASPTSAA